jgi:hypothetical protein
MMIRHHNQWADNYSPWKPAGYHCSLWKPAGYHCSLWKPAGYHCSLWKSVGIATLVL